MRRLHEESFTLLHAKIWDPIDEERTGYWLRSTEAIVKNSSTDKPSGEPKNNESEVTTETTKPAGSSDKSSPLSSPPEKTQESPAARSGRKNVWDGGEKIWGAPPSSPKPIKPAALSMWSGY